MVDWTYSIVPVFSCSRFYDVEIVTTVEVRLVVEFLVDSMAEAIRR